MLNGSAPDISGPLAAVHPASHAGDKVHAV